MIHETHREIMLRCDTPSCPEVEWLPPKTNVDKWQEQNGWKSDGGVHLCECCTTVERRAA